MSNKMLLSVFGDPILHSKSPLLWNAAFSYFGIDAYYFRTKSSDARTVISLIKSIGLTACNVTSPLKESIIPFIDELSDEAKEIQAVNTIINKNGKLYGYNTDWIGAVQALKNNKIEIKNKKVIVLGAGGAAKAAVYGLAKEGPREILILNRTVYRAKEIAKKYTNVARAGSIEDIYNELSDTEIIITCIPEAVSQINLDKLDKRIKILCADYKQKDISTNFIQGCEWLLYQAIASFKLVFGQDACFAMNESLKISKKHKEKISLLGFMGSGKTSIGEEISKKMNCNLVDTDKEIERIEQKTVSEIFKEKGETFFRKIEAEVLKNAIDSNAKIISTGGGIVLNQTNCSLLFDNTLRVWIWSDIKEIVQRIDNSTRPLLSEELFYQRISLYAANTDVCIINSDKDLNNVCRSLIDEIN